MRASSVYAVVLVMLLGVLAGCGYSTRSALPARLKTIYVQPFPNKIDFTSGGARNVYFPLLEVKARDAVINRFLFDGNLRIAEADRADMVLSGELVAYQRDALRYTDNDDVQEYRVQIIMNLSLLDAERGEVLWEEKGFAGDATYFLSGPQATSESAAVEDATTDLARRIVERTIENW